jgi:addiction module RelE/StbE family toxin
LKKLRWSVAAVNDLEEIAKYLKLNHPNFANETIQRIYNSAKSLKKFPDKGRLGKIVGTRELILVPLPYLIVYSVELETVEILRIFHGAQDRT